MKQVPEMPKTGQFAVVYIGSNNKPWGETLKWKDGKLLIYKDCVFSEEVSPFWQHYNGAIFFIK